MTERLITFNSGARNLAGVLTLPDGDGPFPAALIVAGSGPLDRDGNIKKMRLNMSLDLAALLTGSGWASLRFDKRGVGESEGDYLSTGLEDELNDVLASYEWLNDQPEVSRVVAIGHSVGATMATELAVRRPGLSGAVLLAPTAKTGEETLAWQTQQIRDHILPRPIKFILRLFRTDVVKQQKKAVRRLKETTEDVARIQLVKVNAKWMREFIAYDPLPTLEGMRGPVLAITGAADVQVDPADLVKIAEILPAAEIHRVDDLDHLLRREEAEISNPRFYRKQIQKPIDERVTSLISDWLDRRPSDSFIDSNEPSYPSQNDPRGGYR